jgi:hypothetical protein
MGVPFLDEQIEQVPAGYDERGAFLKSTVTRSFIWFRESCHMTLKPSAASMLGTLDNENLVES